MQGERDWTPLHLAAARRGNLISVRLLIEEGADIQATTVDGKTALYLAAQWY